MVKKTTGILILFVLILGMTACGNTADDMTIGETEQILAEYLEANNPDNTVTVQDANGQTLTLLNDEIKAKTIDEAKE